jgi:hypothetical protein
MIMSLLPENMPNKPRTAETTKLFSEYMTHARHLENYLLSFTQLFLLVTGALWGYALVQIRASLSGALNGLPAAEQLASSTNPPFGLRFQCLVFGFHLLYCVAGCLFVVRLSVNYRKNFEMARRALIAGGSADYAIYVHPESPDGRIAIRGVSNLLRLLLTAKAFFLLIYVGAAGVDAYYIFVVASWLRQVQTRPFALLAPLVVMSLLMVLAIYVNRECSRDVAARRLRKLEERQSTGSEN